LCSNLRHADAYTLTRAPIYVNTYTLTLTYTLTHALPYTTATDLHPEHAGERQRHYLPRNRQP
jgi:hypothetical protein